MDQLTIPHRLYGRDRDLIVLLDSFERVSGGHGEVLLVPGASGVGKTALVHELRLPIRDRNGFFVSGKFDQYQQNIPYFAFRQALAELCRELRSGDARQSARFKVEILQAIGDLGRVLVDLVPELEAFLGPQPPLGEISPQEARHRFADVLCHFLKVVCRPEHPLVLFLDDWQWADAASLELLKRLQVGTALRYLLVIVSYRDNEVDAGHPLTSTVADLRSYAVPVVELPVKNLTLEDVRELVVDTLQPATEDLAGLASVIHAKTLGNPFFLRSFLDFLHEFNRIWFDPARNSWQWRVEQAGGTDLPGNVVELFVMKLRRLDPETQALFSLAACLGNRFDLETLSIISGRDPEQCLALLYSEPAKDVLLPWAGGGGNSPAEAPRAPRVCAFAHDRLQQAAYTLMEPAQLPGQLLKIGRLLLTNLNPESLAERLFEVVNDLNAGYELIQDTAEQVKVVELNLRAARKAYAAIAYRSALQFYRAATRFLEKPGLAEHLWRDGHELTMSLFKERAECEFLEGDPDEAQQCIQQSVAHSRTALEQADALSPLIVQYTLLARYPEAIAAGRQALALLGISLPEADYEEARDWEIARARQELGSRSVSSLFELPAMRDPEMLLASRILITMGPPCYRSHQRLWSVLVPKVVNLTLRYGNIPQIGYSHPAFGGLLGWVDGDYATAKEFAEVATRLMTGTFRSPSEQSVFYLMIGSSVRHWFKHLRHGTQDYTDAYEIGLRSGNLQYAAYAFGHDMYCRFYQGVPLATLIQESQRSLAFSRTRLNQWAIDLLEGGLSIFGALSGEGSAGNGQDAWSEEQYVRRVEEHQNIQVACIYKVLKTFALLVSGDDAGALALSDETEPLIYTVGTQGLLPWPEHVFARLLILTSLYARAEATRQTQWRAELDLMLGRLRVWADNGPENFEHKYLLAAAELARIDGRSLAAMRLYDQAVDAAQAGNFPQWEGVANERAYRFWRECGKDRLAQVYWQQAYVCFHRWGAAAKVGAMETDYRAYLGQDLPAGDGAGNPAASPEPEIQHDLRERQIRELRNYALQKRQTRLRIEAATQTEELAHATQRLRVEIAERKKAEESLNAIKTKLELALQSSNMGVWQYHLAENKRSFDPQACLLLGIDPATFGGAAADFYAAVHPEDREKLKAALHQTLARNVPYEPEYRAIWSDGSVHYLTARGRLARDDRGHLQAINGILWDITERQRAAAEKEALEAQNRQLQKSESLGRMAGAIAHHFNNQLQAVMMGLKMAMNDVPRHAGPVENLTEAMLSARKAAAVSGLMLTYLGVTVGKSEPMDLSDACRRHLPLLRAGIPQSVVLENDLPSPGPTINANANQLQQVLTNLVTNAVEATGDGRSAIHLTIKTASAVDISSASRFPVDWQPHDPAYACLEVRDTGCGIPERDIEKIFDPFFSTKFTGRGMGLAVVLGIMRSYHGGITVESKPGRGSIFRAFFPVSAEAVPQPPAPTAQSPTFRGSGILLLVEDEPVVRQVVAKALTGAGFTVLAAKDGVEAVEIFQQHQGGIRLVLSDLTMPRMNGWETLTALRQLAPGLPVILSSGYNEAQVMAGDHPVLPQAFLSKPYEYEELINAIARVLTDEKVPS